MRRGEVCLLVRGVLGLVGWGAWLWARRGRMGSEMHYYVGAHFYLSSSTSAVGGADWSGGEKINRVTTISKR